MLVALWANLLGVGVRKGLVGARRPTHTFLGSLRAEAVGSSLAQKLQERRRHLELMATLTLSLQGIIRS